MDNLIDKIQGKKNEIVEILIDNVTGEEIDLIDLIICLKNN